MKLKLDEFEQQLALLKSMPAGDARTAMFKNLKSAEVVEVDKDGKETPVSVKIIGEEPDAKADTEAATKVDEAAVERLVNKRLEEIRKANPLPANPLGEGTQKAGEFVIPASAKRYGQVRNFKQAKVGKFDRQERAYRFGMWALGCLGNENAKRFCAEQGITIKLHQSSVNTAGGFLVPEEFGTDLIDLRLEYGVFRRNARIEPMTSDTKTVPRRTGGLTAYFVSEGSAGTESTKGWDQVRLVAKDLMVISRMTNQLSEDAVISIGDDLAGEIGYAFALKEDQCGFLGDGTSTYGGIVGVTTALSNINGTDDGGGLVLGSGNTYSELVLGDFHKVVGRTPTYARKGAKWFVSPNFHDSVMQKLLTAAGGNTIQNIQAGGGPVFLGYPVELAEVMPTTEANSQIAAVFGDLSLAARFGDRQQDMIDFSTQATVGGQSLWERNEIGIRGTQRFDIVVHDVGTATIAGPIVGLILASG